jgi:hypothetical protein
MGTSASSGGTGSNTPLVPTWLDGDVTPTPSVPPMVSPPASMLPNEPHSPNGASIPSGHPQVPGPAVPGIAIPTLTTTLPTSPAAPYPNRFQTARVNFTRYAKSGGNDRKALGRAIRSYVSRASGGAERASRRMGASRSAAANIVDVLGRLQRDGVQRTLRHFNIDAAFDASPQDTFLALTDVICADGGLVDEAIARDAWCEIAAGIDDFGITDLAAMTDSQRREVFAGFVGKTIELRIQNDVGNQGFKIAGTPLEIRQISEGLANYIRTATRDEIMSQFPTSLANVTTSQLKAIGVAVYDKAWAILETYKGA